MGYKILFVQRWDTTGIRYIFNDLSQIYKRDPNDYRVIRLFSDLESKISHLSNII